MSVIATHCLPFSSTSTTSRKSLWSALPRELLAAEIWSCPATTTACMSLWQSACQSVSRLWRSKDLNVETFYRESLMSCGATRFPPPVGADESGKSCRESSSAGKAVYARTRSAVVTKMPDSQPTRSLSDIRSIIQQFAQRLYHKCDTKVPRILTSWSPKRVGSATAT